jgi:hypothetical protein
MQREGIYVERKSPHLGGEIVSMHSNGQVMISYKQATQIVWTYNLALGRCQQQ